MLPPSASAEQIAAAIDRLLGDPDFAVRAQALGREVAREAEQSPIVEILEDLSCPAYA